MTPRNRHALPLSHAELQRGHTPKNSNCNIYWLLTPEFTQYASHVQGRTVLPKINRDQLQALPVPVPPLREQERIVAAIEEQLPRINAGMAALERVRQNLKRMQSAVIQEAVLSTQDAGAEPVTLNDLVHPDRKMAYGVLVPGDDVPGGVPFVRVGDLSGRGINIASLKRISQAVASKYPRTFLQGGEVLLSLVGTIGRTAVVPPELAGANAARALAVIPVRDGVDPRYVAIVLSQNRVTAELTTLSHEVARKTLNLEDVRSYAIPLPPHDQQLEMVERVEELETWLSATEHLLFSAIRRSELLRNALLTGAFSGDLVPQDPGDEPARVLLERIAAERPASNGRQLASRTCMKVTA